MTEVDYAILAVLLISLVIGVWRGFVREALSVVIWVAAFWGAYSGAEALGLQIEGAVGDKALSVLVAFIFLFLAVHVAGFFLSRLLSKVVSSIGLKSVDRVAGAGFGFLRGFVIVAVLVLLISYTPLNASPLWTDSYMVGVVNDALGWLQERYPLGLDERLASVAD